MKIHPGLKPGHKFPDFELPDQEGNVLKLSQRMRGWPTWRIFWTITCHDLQHGAEIGCLRDLYRIRQHRER